MKMNQSENEILIIKETGKYGKGVFAARDISEGEKIIKFTGEVIDLEERTRRVDNGEMGNGDGLQIDKEKYIILDPIPFLFNHSCSPNSAFKKEADLLAIRGIKKDEEITYDYSVVAGPNITPEMWTMVCKCGSSNCRKKLGNVLTLPKKVLEDYKRRGFLQDYIIKQL